MLYFLYRKCIRVSMHDAIYTTIHAQWKVFSLLKPLAEQIGIFALSSEISSGQVVLCYYADYVY